jgi:hypothetical protein
LNASVTTVVLPPQSFAIPSWGCPITWELIPFIAVKSTHFPSPFPLWMAWDWNHIPISAVGSGNLGAFQ